MSTSVIEDARPVTNLTNLLAGLGVEHLDSQPELAIDRFDQWTNPPGAVLACTCSLFFGTDAELDRAA